MRLYTKAANSRSTKEPTRASLERRRVRDLARLHDAWTVLTTTPAASDAALLVAVLAASAVKS